MLLFISMVIIEIVLTITSSPPVGDSWFHPHHHATAEVSWIPWASRLASKLWSPRMWRCQWDGHPWKGWLVMAGHGQWLVKWLVNCGYELHAKWLVNKG